MKNKSCGVLAHHGTASGQRRLQYKSMLDAAIVASLEMAGMSEEQASAQLEDHRRKWIGGLRPRGMQMYPEFGKLWWTAK